VKVPDPVMQLFAKIRLFKPEDTIFEKVHEAVEYLEKKITPEFSDIRVE
jgi:hypothetical protein